MTSGIAPNVEELLSIALDFAAYISNPSTWSLRPLLRGPEDVLRQVPLTLQINGDVVVADQIARCEYLIRDDWARFPPGVKTDAPWMKTGAEWHVYTNGEICWTYFRYYRDMFTPYHDT